jgi:DUF4097 and DUF4098 domain-containing protein YvlB
MSRSFKTGPTPNVVVEMFNGPIVITTAPEHVVDVRVTKAAHELTEDETKELLPNLRVSMSQEGNPLKVVAAPRDPKSGAHGWASASAEVRVPAGALLELRTCNASVTLTGGSGAARIDIANGSIDVRNHRGDLHLKTSNGPIVVVGGTGKLELRTSNAAIDVSADQAAVTARTSNGPVRFRGSFRDGTHIFRSMNGSIECTLPADARFRLDAGTSEGRVTSAFALKILERRSADHLRGVVGDNPGVVISARTSRADILIGAAR